jgi:hypothetical protein
MLSFAVWRRSAVGDAQPARVAHGEKGPVALCSLQPILPYRLFTICGAPLLNTFVRIKRGFGYTQVWQGSVGDHRPYADQ